MSQSQVELLDLLQAGVHFGHKTSKKHPKMDPFIFGSRNGVSVINLERTQLQLEKVLPVIEEMVAQGKTILFLGTKRQAQRIVKETAEEISMPYIVERWLGGLITNYSSVSGSMRKLTDLKEGRDSGDWDKRFNKKERLVLQREVERLDRIVGGIEKMEKVPDALFVVDCGKEATAVREANRNHIPVIAITDTNVNPDNVTFAIPGNDDGVKSIQFILDLVKETCKRGQARYEILAAEMAKKAADDAVTAAKVAAENAKAEAKAAAEAAQAVAKANAEKAKDKVADTVAETAPEKVAEKPVA